MEVLFIDHYLCSIFPLEQNMVPQHLKPVVVFASFHKQDSNTNETLLAEKPPEQVNATNTNPVQLAQQKKMPPSTTQAIVVTTLANDLVIVVSCYISAKRQLTVADRKIVEVLPS